MKSSLVVANRFLQLAEARGDSLTPMQLLKLVYIAHGWMLGLHGRPLVSDEVQAWQYGPVIPALYAKLRSYKGNSVSEPISVVNDHEVLDLVEDDIIEQVYDLYGSLSGMALSRITHAKGTPWSQIYEIGSFGRVIPIDLIEDHYRRLDKNRAATAN
ncbi:MAG: Panacea domain-containing protein [Sphingomonadaceae bacterium]